MAYTNKDLKTFVEKKSLKDTLDRVKKDLKEINK